MEQPNLFIVGAPKCGTTSLARWLGMHPNVFLPSVKEPHHYNVDEIHVKYPARSDYLALYSAGVSYRYRLDASVWYLHSTEAIPRILEDCPDAKFIVCLRNPADMAFSLHSHLLYKSRKETVLSFEEAWELSDERRVGRCVPALASDHRYLAYKYSCRIGSQTKRLLDIVPAEQVQLIVLDDLIERPAQTLKDLLFFLDISERIQLSIPHENIGQSVKYPAVNRALVRLAKLKKLIGIKHIPVNIKSLVKKINPTKEKQRMNESTRRVVTEYFLDEICTIWELTGIRYDKWVKCLEDRRMAESAECKVDEKTSQ